MAQWSAPQPSVNCGIWQKSDCGKIDEINGNVDLNESYKDYPAIMKSKGLNGFESDNSSVLQTFTPASPPQQNTYKTYTVVKGDSLWSIAQKQLGDSTKWKQIYDLNNLRSDIICPGQILKIPI